MFAVYFKITDEIFEIKYVNHWIKTSCIYHVYNSLRLLSRIYMKYLLLTSKFCFYCAHVLQLCINLLLTWPCLVQLFFKTLSEIQTQTLKFTAKIKFLTWLPLTLSSQSIFGLNGSLNSSEWLPHFPSLDQFNLTRNRPPELVRSVYIFHIDQLLGSQCSFDHVTLVIAEGNQGKHNDNHYGNHYSSDDAHLAVSGSFGLYTSSTFNVESEKCEQESRQTVYHTSFVIVLTYGNNYSGSSIIRTSIIRSWIILTQNLAASRAQFNPFFRGYKQMQFSFCWILNFVD